MRILIVFNHPAPYKVRLFNELAKSIDLTVIFERHSASDRPRLFYGGDAIKFRAIFLHGLNFGKENSLSFGVRHILTHESFDRVVMNGYSTLSEIIAIRYLQRHHVPYALYINGGVIRRRECCFKKRFKISLIKPALYYLSPCEEADAFLTYYGADSKAIHHYPYSTVYDKELWRGTPQEKAQAKAALGCAGKTIFVSAGQLIARKNVLGLLSLWTRVDPANHLFIIGSGQQKKACAKIIARNHLTNVTLLDYKKKEDLLVFYHACDAFITLSKEDIYGHMINEALSQNLPVISSSNVVAARHLIQNGINGFLVAYDNPQEILNAIKAIATTDFHDTPYLTAKQNTLETMAVAHQSIFEEKQG